MSWNEGVFEDVEDGERFGEKFNVLFLCASFDCMCVASFCGHDCSVDFLLFHDLVEGVHGCDADCGFVEDAPDDGFLFFFGDLDDVGDCAFVFFFADEFVFS